MAGTFWLRLRFNNIWVVNEDFVGIYSILFNGVIILLSKMNRYLGFMYITVNASVLSLWSISESQTHVVSSRGDWINLNSTSINHSTMMMVKLLSFRKGTRTIMNFFVSIFFLNGEFYWCSFINNLNLLMLSGVLLLIALNRFWLISK